LGEHRRKKNPFFSDKGGVGKVSSFLLNGNRTRERGHIFGGGKLRGKKRPHGQEVNNKLRM